MLQVPTVQTKFSELRDQWYAETAHLPDIEQRCTHFAYQKIIGIGPDAVPLILRELQKNTGDWFWALTAITCEDPIPEVLHGKMRVMADVWVEWGRKHDYI